MNLRKRCQQVYQAGKELETSSLRKIARHTNLSKSSVHRLCQRIKHRHQYPESDFWERPEGYQWLRLYIYCYHLYIWHQTRDWL